MLGKTMQGAINEQINADEVLVIAEQIERNGARFYRRAAEGFKDEKPGNLLLGLAAMEDKHERVFAAMRGELGQSDSFDPDGQAIQYLNALADGHIFDPRKDPSEKLTGGESLEEVLQMAIGIEKDSIVFYLGLKEAVPESLGRDRIDRIIKEEMAHLVSLSRELASLKGDLQ